MTMSPLHPDHLAPGNQVGPWRILELLGGGGGGRLFKVEREEHPGRPFTLKVALRPAGQHEQEEEDADGRVSREAAIHMAYDTGLKVHALDHWLGPSGYLYFVTDYVEGETFTEWCWRVKPTAARLLDVFTEVVRLVDKLHRRQLCHRDLKGANILIRKEDGQPVLIDFGVARQPGMATLTVGVPPTSPHLLPPESLTFLAEGSWKEGAAFEPGPAGDLYALGALLYEALTDGYAFDPTLPYDKLVLAIATKVPAAPHVLNPRVPRALGDIALRLLAKHPEDRYAGTEALLQALWDAAKEKKKPEWQVSLEPPLPEEVGTSETPIESDSERSEAPTATEEDTPEDDFQSRPAVPTPGWTRGRAVAWALCGALAVFLALWLALSMLAPSFEKGSSLVPTPTVSALRRLPLARHVAALVCATAGLACPSVPTRPDSGVPCPEASTQAMFQRLKLRKPLKAVIDINQPGDQSQVGTYQAGPVVGRIVGYSWADPALPDGTLLYGRLWMGPGIYDHGEEAVIIRYTEARLPDGSTYPVCIVLGGGDGRVPKLPGSDSGSAVLPRELPAVAVWSWP
ncbi:serine/threonine protein kinase [Corallococcus carmarthensis]|uniref:non-specific serine/threonine protein kinase n=1 Tax=Corallococcus carmarthensis TaxID=2316728 RepID=A0A3A8JX91_9BACT|nr:serine/threonine-protein kinase [Corallococcus carmarthensis]RKG99518.1 serine/threonine protein kinase [Corallococcus carmarthensis]